MSAPRVAILMGSKSDLDLMQPAADTLRELGVPCELRVLSAHRTPGPAMELASTARERGLEVLICAAGGAAHLAGVIAAHTTLPVIGVPLARTPLGGVDALYATVQMPAGIPVATVAVDGAVNAGLLAAQIIGVADAEVAARVQARREATTSKVIADDEGLVATQRGG
jgi:5-(carboxyamino)imidazole ribonucleotide mutase